MKVDFFATVNIGLEDIAILELRKLFGIEAFKGNGLVRFSGSLEDIYKLNSFSRTIHKLIIILGEFDFEDLKDLFFFAYNLSYTRYIDRNQSFAVRVERIGKHEFNSLQASARIGEGIINSFLDETGHRLKVDLENPDVEFFCRIEGNRAILGINTTGISLRRRGYRKFSHPAALSPTIASSMIYISEWSKDEILLDPMCGGCTILLEAYMIANEIPVAIFRELKGISYAFKRLNFYDEGKYREIISKRDFEREVLNLLALDSAIRFLKGSKLNLINAGAMECMNLVQGDARKLPFRYFDVMVTNPPYGKRSGDIPYIRKLYREFLYEIKRNPFKKLVIITAAPRILRKAIEENNLRIVKEFFSLHGDLPVKIFRVEQ